MERPLIYFDNAATSFPKPELVYRECDAVLRAAGNPGRGAHRLALDTARTVFDARSVLAEFLGLAQAQADRLTFMPGCTQAINTVLQGIDFQPGDCVVVSSLEHNAVMRPLTALQKRFGINIEQLSYAARNIIDTDELNKLLKSRQPRLCVFTDASNVTGEKLDLAAVSEICRENAVELLVDAAQTAGTKSGALQEDGITYWAAPGHKALMGSPGVGALFIRDGRSLRPLISGGTGSASEQLEMPQQFPDRLEAGTPPVPAIASIAAGVRFIQEIGVEQRNRHESHLAGALREWCRSKDWIDLAGNSFKQKDCDLTDAAPVVSLRLKKLGCDRVADILDREYNIAVRAGLHCAALAHKTLDTLDQGLVRVSFGFFNTLEELSQLFVALEEINAR